jgi:hypothetical protein
VRRVVLVVASAFALASGCVAPAPTGPTGGAPLPADAAVAALCDGARAAVAHHASGAAVEGAPPAPVPCLARTGFNGGESTIGVSRKTGHVFYFAATLPNTPRGVARSADEGATWTRVIPDVNGDPTTGTHRTSLDPYFYLDPATDRMFVDDLSGPAKCSLLSYSDDEGKTWKHTVAGCTQFDHTSIFAGKPVTSTTSGYPNVVYHCAYQAGLTSIAGFGASCERSTDGGMTWLATRTPISTPTLGAGNNEEPLCNGALGHGTTGPDGTVFVPHGFCGQPMLAISRDEGDSWTNVKVSDLGMPFDGENYGHDGAVGVDPDGTVYYAWIARDRLPHLTVSRDAGKTWSPPVPIGVPGLRESSNLELTVGAAGKIAFVYMGSTNSPGGPFAETPCTKDPAPCVVGSGPDYSNVSWSAYMGMSVDALDGDPTFQTASVNPESDPLIRGTCGITRCQEVGDFVDIRIGPDGTPWASLVDGCKGACATDPKGSDNAREAIVGRLVGGASLLT